jgi:6-phosphofructokinase
MHATILIPTRAHTLLSLAQVEARSARNGLGLVKLMGRQSGFIAMQASMASGDDDEHIHDAHGEDAMQAGHVLIRTGLL